MIFINNTENNCKYYLYQYIRIDNNTPFYVGIGTRYSGKKDFSRAKKKHTNKLCLGIIKQTDYKIEILEETDDYNLIKAKEQHLIQKYGKIIDNTGSLANFTNGGDGTINLPAVWNYKKCYVYDKNGSFIQEFSSISSAAKYYNTQPSIITNNIKRSKQGLNYTLKNCQFRDVKYDNILPVIEQYKIVSKCKSKVVLQLDINGSIIKEWKSMTEAAKYLKIKSSGQIGVCCRNSNTTAAGFKWKYKY